VFAFVSLFSGNKLNVVVLTDYAKGDKNKISRLRESQILSAAQIFTTSNFTEKEESDLEDIFSAELYIKLVNLAFDLPKKNLLTRASIDEQDGDRIVKKIEAMFRVLPESVADFDHFSPSSYLLKHPELLEGDSDDIKETLDRFENMFKIFNKLLTT
jgi:hypothetical protein